MHWSADPTLMPGVPGIGVRSAHRPGGTGTKETAMSMTRDEAIKYFDKVTKKILNNNKFN
jgi:hypothetical protein